MSNISGDTYSNMCQFMCKIWLSKEDGTNWLIEHNNRFSIKQNGKCPSLRTLRALVPVIVIAHKFPSLFISLE